MSSTVLFLVALVTAIPSWCWYIFLRVIYRTLVASASPSFQLGVGFWCASSTVLRLLLSPFFHPGVGFSWRCIYRALVALVTVYGNFSKSQPASIFFFGGSLPSFCRSCSCCRDLRPKALTGSKMEKICDKVHITLNKNAVQVSPTRVSPSPCVRACFTPRLFVRGTLPSSKP